MGIMADLAKGKDFAAAVEREEFRALVARQITCPIGGQVLDVKTAVRVEMNHPATGDLMGRNVFHQDTWAKHGEMFKTSCETDGLTYTVTLGSELFA